MLVQRQLRIQTEVQADVNGREFIPKLILSLQQKQRTFITKLLVTHWGEWNPAKRGRTGEKIYETVVNMTAKHGLWLGVSQTKKSNKIIPCWQWGGVDYHRWPAGNGSESSHSDRILFKKCLLLSSNTESTYCFSQWVIMVSLARFTPPEQKEWI